MALRNATIPAIARWSSGWKRNLAEAAGSASSWSATERARLEPCLRARAYPPITVPMTCQGETAVAMIDQIRTVAKYRLHSKIETASPARVQVILTALAQILEMT